MLLLDRSQAEIGLHIAMLCRSLIRKLDSIVGRLEVQFGHKYLGCSCPRNPPGLLWVSFRLAKFIFIYHLMNLIVNSYSPVTGMKTPDHLSP